MDIKKPFVIKIMGYCDCSVRLEVSQNETFSYFVTPAFSDYKESIRIEIGENKYSPCEKDYPPCEWRKLKTFLVNIYENLDKE